MMELIIARHGETDGNIQGRYLGWTDSVLNQNGIKQAYILKEKLKNEKVDFIYSSSLKRALRTTQIINEAHELEILISDNLKERNFGVFDNLTYSEICGKFPKETELWAKDWVNYPVEYGESAFKVHERVCDFVKILLNSYQNGTFVVITHLGCIRSIIAFLLGLSIEDTWHFKVDNCGITRFEIRDNYPVLTLLNG